MNFEVLKNKQRHVVQMLEARDVMNSHVHMTDVRWSPVTESAREVLNALREMERLYAVVGARQFESEANG